MVGLVSRRSAGGMVVVGLAAVLFAQSASAGDGDFFSSIFGGGAQPAPAPQYADPGALDGYTPPVRRRPLTVRLRRPKISVAKPDGKVVKVSIYEDRTLRSSSWPYQQSDFVAISAAGRMNGTYQKALLDLDRPASR